MKTIITKCPICEKTHGVIDLTELEPGKLYGGQCPTTKKGFSVKITELAGWRVDDRFPPTIDPRQVEPL